MIVKSLSELQLYVNMLQIQKKKVYTDHKEILKDLKYEFNIDSSFQQLNEMYEPTIEEEMLDREFLYRNIFY